MKEITQLVKKPKYVKDKTRVANGQFLTPNMRSNGGGFFITSFTMYFTYTGEVNKDWRAYMLIQKGYVWK